MPRLVLVELMNPLFADTSHFHRDFVKLILLVFYDILLTDKLINRHTTDFVTHLCCRRRVATSK